MAPVSLPERIRAALEPYMQRTAVPGVAAAISYRDEVHVLALGTLALTSAEPVQRDSLFRISSMTKPVTAAAALLLVDRGVITLDEPIERLLPELADRRVLRQLNSPLTDTVPADRPVTVRDLLTFTDGFGQLYRSPTDHPIVAAALSAGLRMGPPAPASQSAPDDWLAQLGSLPLMRQPGHSFLYDTAYDVLSVLIARAAGTDFATFLQDNLFEPLGMVDTSFSVPASKVHRLAAAYTPGSTGLELTDDPRTGQWASEPAFHSGAGGLVSTCDDYLKFARMILNQGRTGSQQLLSPAAVRLMTTDAMSPVQKSRSATIPLDFSTHTWGMGLALVTAPKQLWPQSSYGWTGGLGTHWMTDPQAEVVAVIMTQVAMTTPDSTQLFDDFARAVPVRG